MVEAITRIPTREITEQPQAVREEARKSSPSLTLYVGDEARSLQVRPHWPTPPIEVWALELPKQLDPRLYMLKDPSSAQARAVRLLRHRLLSAGDPRVVAVTSAKPSEGKTSTSLNLALAMAEDSNIRVLVVEANLARPSIANMLGFLPPRCFARQTKELTAENTAWDVVEIPNTRVHLAAVNAYEWPPPLDRLLLGEAIARLSRAYDYVVVDTPSVLETADVNLISDAVDGVVLTALARKSSRRALGKAVQQLEPAPIAGIALLDSREAE